MKFDGRLLEAETDARAVILKIFDNFVMTPRNAETANGPGAYTVLCNTLMEFAKAGVNHAIEKMAPALLDPSDPGLEQGMMGELRKHFEKHPPKAKRYPTGRICDCGRGPGEGHAKSCSIRRGSGPAECNEIPLGPSQVCELATGTLTMPRTTCQTCGELINAINEDRFGYKHPQIHQKFGSNTICPPMNPPLPFTNSFQSEDRLHRLRPRYSELAYYAPAGGGPGTEEYKLLENLRNKEKILEGLNFRCPKCKAPITAVHTDASGEAHVCNLTDYIKAHPCKGFKVHPAYFTDGDFISVYFANVLCFEETLTPTVYVERDSMTRAIVGVKLFSIAQLGLLHLNPDEIKFLIYYLQYSEKNARGEGTITGSIIKKLEKM